MCAGVGLAYDIRLYGRLKMKFFVFSQLQARRGDLRLHAQFSLMMSGAEANGVSRHSMRFRLHQVQEKSIHSFPLKSRSV